MRKLNLTICNEEFKCRIPGLFACIEYDEFGSHIFKATNYRNGSYGKYVENINIPAGAGIDGVVYERETYSYSTLRKIYKEYLNDSNAVNFINFFNRGIGLINVDRKKISDYTNDINLKKKILDSNITPLIPEVIYYANCKELLDNIYKVKELSEINKIYENKFNSIGGDCMIKYLEDLIIDAQRIADEFYTYADSNNSSSYSLNLQLYNTIDDIGIYETILEPWTGGVEYIVGNIVTYDYKTYRCIKDNHGTYDPVSESYIFNKNGDEFEEVGNNNDIYSNDNTNGGVYSNEDIIIDSYGKSHLKENRFYKDYVNTYGEVERPGEDEDWLFYYRKGNVKNIELSRDGNQNIINFSGNIEPNVSSDGYVHDLLAYGDVITDIRLNTYDKTFTIEYVIGAHLLAKYLKRNIEDGENYVFYDNFIYDPDDIHGIKYDETFNYTPGDEIEQIARNGDFNTFFSHNEEVIIKYNGDYLLLGENFITMYSNTIPNKQIGKYKYLLVRGDDGLEHYLKWNGSNYEYITVDIKNYKFFKFPFKINNHINIVTINDVEVKNKESLAHYITKSDKKVDSFFCPIIKIDYLTGITYNPSVSGDININRGNSAAWERHIKLGEVKTIQDLERYGNDYFKVQKQ